MPELKFDWNATIESEEKVESNSLKIKGVLVDTSVCSNNFAVDENEFPKLITQIPGTQLRIDHGKSVRDIIGALTKSEYDKEKKLVTFEAEVDEPDIQRKILKNRVRFVSIGATADAFCSKCHKSTKPFRSCKCEGSFDLIKNIQLKEVSIISEPAYKTTEFSPVGFVASLSSALAEVKVTPSSSEEGIRPDLIKKMEEKEKMPEEVKEVKANTELKPAGEDAIVLLGKKLEEIFKKQEEQQCALVKKIEELVDKIKVKKEEAKQPEEEEEEKKKEEIPKLKVPAKMKKEQPPEEEEEEEEEEEPKKKEEAKKVKVKVVKEESEEEEEEEKKPKKKEEEEEEEEKKPKKPIKGARVEEAEGESPWTQGTLMEAAWREVTAAAKKYITGI